MRPPTRSRRRGHAFPLTHSTRLGQVPIARQGFRSGPWSPTSPLRPACGPGGRVSLHTSLPPPSPRGVAHLDHLGDLRSGVALGRPRYRYLRPGSSPIPGEPGPLGPVRPGDFRSRSRRRPRLRVGGELHGESGSRGEPPPAHGVPTRWVARRQSCMSGVSRTGAARGPGPRGIAGPQREPSPPVTKEIPREGDR